MALDSLTWVSAPKASRYNLNMLAPVQEKDQNAAGKERRQQGGVVEEIEEVCEGEMAEASASPSDKRDSARGSKADQSAVQSAMQSAVSAVHERNSAPLSGTAKAGQAKPQKKESEMSAHEDRKSNIGRPRKSQEQPHPLHTSHKQEETGKSGLEADENHKRPSDPVPDGKSKEPKAQAAAERMKKLEEGLAGLAKDANLSKDQRQRSVEESKRRKDTDPKDSKRREEPELKKAKSTASPGKAASEVKEAQNTEMNEEERQRLREMREAHKAKSREMLLLRELNLTDDREAWDQVSLYVVLDVSFGILGVGFLEELGLGKDWHHRSRLRNLVQ